MLIQNITLCEQLHDHVSRDLLEELLAHREQAIDWLETRPGLIREVSLPNHPQAQMEGG